MGLTPFAPIANGRPQADRNAVANQRPTCWMQRRADRSATATRTQMLYCTVPATDIELAGVQFSWNLIHEFRRDLEKVHEGRSL